MKIESDKLVRKQTVVAHLMPGTDNPRNSEGAFVELSGGRILFVYSKYSGMDWNDDGVCNLVGRMSYDRGRSWEQEDRLVVPHGSAVNVMSPSLLRLPNGRILLFYVRKSHAEGEKIDCLPFMAFSDNEGEDWQVSSHSIASVPGGYIVNNDRVILLKSGRIIVPVAVHRLIRTGEWNPHGIAMAFISDDYGASFRQSAECMTVPECCDSGLQEPGMIELEDNSIVAYCRTTLGCQYEAFSADGGDHWSQARPSGFKSPLSPLSMKRNPFNGDLYAVWNDHSERWNDLVPKPEESSWGRTPLVLACSDNNGETWENRQLIAADPKRGYCYTAMLFTAKDELLLAFCSGGAGNAVLQETTLMLVELIEKQYESMRYKEDARAWLRRRKRLIDRQNINFP